MIKQNIYNNIILSILGIILGIIICVIDPSKLLAVIFTCAGIFTVFCAIISLLELKQSKSEKEKNYVLISAIVMLAIGLLLIIYPNWIATIICGVFLLALPIYRIIINNNRLNALKKEATKLILGVILIFFGVGSVVKILLYIAGGIVILVSTLLLVYSIILLVKINKKDKKNKEDNDVIDV